MSWVERTTPSKAQTVVVTVGYEGSVPEPLLLQAMARQDECKHLYLMQAGLDSRIGYQNLKKMHDYIEKKLEGKPATPPAYLQAVDIKPLIQHRALDTPEAVEAFSKEIEAIQHGDMAGLQRVNPKAVNLLIGRSNYLECEDMLPFVMPHACFVNDVHSSETVNNKRALPVLKQRIGLIADCKNIETPEEAEAYLAAHGNKQIVLKLRDSIAGYGVVKLSRHADGSLWCNGPTDLNRPYIERLDEQESAIGGADQAWANNFDEIQGSAPPDVGVAIRRAQAVAARNYPLHDLLIPDGGMLAMEWMEPSKGDIRIVAMNGRVVGGYKRMPPEGAWLCNVAQGGKVQPVDWQKDFSPEDMDKLEDAVASLSDGLNLNWVALDLMANAKGERHITEFNLGNSDDFVDLYAMPKHGQEIRRESLLTNVAVNLLEMGISHAKYHEALAQATRV